MTTYDDDRLSDTWPKQARGVTVEPGTGNVRVCRRGNKPAILDVPAARELAAAADRSAPDVVDVLTAAADEAERQARAIAAAMEQPV